MKRLINAWPNYGIGTHGAIIAVDESGDIWTTELSDNPIIPNASNQWTRVQSVLPAYSRDIPNIPRTTELL